MPLDDRTLVTLPRVEKTPLPAQQHSTQLTLDQLFNTHGRTPDLSSGKKRKNPPAGKRLPIGHVVNLGTLPDTPPRAEHPIPATLTPAEHLRLNIAQCASPKATVHVGTQESPQVVTKPDRSGLQLRSARIRITQGDMHARFCLFGATSQKSYLQQPLGSEIKWDNRKFLSFKQKNKLIDSPIYTAQAKITLDNIRANEAVPRTTKQDDVMKHTAISHMRAIGIANTTQILYQWGHLIAYIINGDDPPVPKNLMVVTPSANMLEARMTAGLRKALETFHGATGHWELVITAHRIKVTTDKGAVAYLPHVSHHQDYQYTYVHPDGHRSEPLTFTIKPLEPNHISYEDHTHIFANLFAATMRSADFFHSRQKKLDFSARKAVSIATEPMLDDSTLGIEQLSDAEEDEEPFSPNKIRATSANQQEEEDEYHQPTTPTEEQDEQLAAAESLYTGKIVPMYMDGIDSDEDQFSASMLTPPRLPNAAASEPVHVGMPLETQVATQLDSSSIRDSSTQRIAYSLQTRRKSSDKENNAPLSSGRIRISQQEAITPFTTRAAFLPITVGSHDDGQRSNTHTPILFASPPQSPF